MPGLSNVGGTVRAWGRSAWRRNRTELGRGRALGNRVVRMGFLVARGIVVHRVGMLAASLTFFTVFSAAPMLVVILWTLKWFGRRPRLELPAQGRLSDSGQVLHDALKQFLDAIWNASDVPGVIGLLALLYIAMKMFSFTERALHTIAGGGRSIPRMARSLGYLALLLVVPVVVALTGFLSPIIVRSLGIVLPPQVGAFPGFQLVLMGTFGFAALWLATTLLYWSAVRARIPFSSAAVGGLASAVGLPAVFLVYAYFQIDVAHWSAVGSGLLAFPILLMWSFSSWFALLIGAEIAVAHHVDATLAQGARAFSLDLRGERQASMGLLLHLAHAGEDARMSDDDLARALRLPPSVVRDLCVGLVDRGLLVERGSTLGLGFDPGRTTLAELTDAVECDPRFDAHEDALLPPTVRRALSSPAASSPTLAHVAAQMPPA